MLTVSSATRLFDTPRIFFTVAGNPLSEKALGFVKERLKRLEGSDVEVHVFPDEAAVKAYFEQGISPLSAVVLFDSPHGVRMNTRVRGKRYQHLARNRPEDNGRIPHWAQGAQWAVVLYSPYESIGHQLVAHYVVKFKDQLKRQQFPWGCPRNGERVPGKVDLPDMSGLLGRLNGGPDLAANIADNGHVATLPTGSRISWLRIPSEPVTCDTSLLRRITRALSAFEGACGKLLQDEPELGAEVLAGVTLPEELQELYLGAPAHPFSVTRPDLHYAGGKGISSVFASEVDEMPGGFAELVHLDTAYGINQRQWRETFEWLTSEGRLVFLVSHEWSRCYYEETGWMVKHMSGLGYDVALVTTDNLEVLSISGDRLYHDGARVGTVWRLFPVFECSGFLVDLVRLSHEGGVRMVPEFAPWGNKAWFSIARSHQGEFRRLLSEEDWEVVDAILPDSRLVLGPQSFPLVVREIRVETLGDLRELQQTERDKLVLKVVGANTLAARSYGVLMGHGLTQKTWKSWINERIAGKQPFIVQSCLETTISHLPVFNTERNGSELFPCRVLIRPWTVGGELVSAHGCAVPSNTLRVHGMVDMAVVPFSLS